MIARYLASQSNSRRRVGQQGAFLLEALIAILIFCFGVLGLIGLQAQSIRYVSDSQYRAEATYLVNSYISKMWSADPTQWVAQFGDPSLPGTQAEAFMQQVTQVPGGLPQPSGGIANNPTIVITPGPATVGNMKISTRASLVTVTVWWLAPGEKVAEVDPVGGKGHSLVVSSIIGMN